MPAACTLLLLLGLGLAPPAGSLPLAPPPPRRLPPPPPPPPPPLPSPRSRLGRPCSPPAAGHAGRHVIDSHQVRRSSDTAMRTSSSLVGDVELVTMLASSREPGAHHFGSPTSTEAFPLPGAGGTASSPPPAVGSRVRGKRALPSPGNPADTETMMTVGAAWSSSSSPASQAHRVLPSTPVPGSPGQPSSSHHAPSTQTGVSSSMLHLEDATGNSASPALTALPASENTSRAAGSSYQPSNSSAAEKRTWGFHTTSTSMSTTATRGAGRTLRSLPASSRLAHAAEISTSGTETIASPERTRSPGLSVGAEAGGGMDATVPSTAPLLTSLSSSASGSAATSFHSSHGPRSIPATGEAILHSEVPLALTSVAVGTLGSPSSSATNPDPSSSLGQTLSSSVAKAHQTDGWQGDTDLTEHPQELTSLLSASEHVFTGIRSSHQPTDTSTAEKETSASSTTSAYVSATATGSGGRPPRSVTNSSRWATEVSAPSSGVSRTSGTIGSSPASPVRATYGAHGARETTGFSQTVEDPLLPRSHSPAEVPTATGSSLASFSILTMERRTDFDATSSSMSTTATRGAGRTLRSLPASSRLAHAAEISTSGTETIASPDRTQSPGPSVGAEVGGGMDATVPSTAPLLTSLSSSASGSAATAKGAITSARGQSLPDTPLTSMPSSVTATSGGERAVEPMTDTSTGSSAPAPASTSSLDIVLLLSSVTEPRRQRDISQSSADLIELPTKPVPVFPPGVLVPSSSPSASVPERGQWISGVPTETTYVLTVLSTRGEGTPRGETNRGTWSTEVESPTSHPGTAGEPHSGPLPSFPAWSGGGHVSSDYAGYTEPKVTLSSRVSTYFSASGEPSTVGISHHSPSSLSTEEEISSPYTDPSYPSATLAGGGEGTRVTSGDLAHSTESSASYTETASFSEPIWPASADQSGTVNASVGSMGFATETLFTHSSEIATGSSFQNDLTSFSSSHQPVSSIDAEKRTSVSHTDGTYISTTYTRGGERTLLSISNSSTSADSSESSTFFSEISNPSDSSKSSVAQDRRSNVSSDGSFVEPSTEPLLVHSSQPLTSASVGNTQNTTLFDTDFEVLPTGRSSLSSSAFPPSSSASPLRHSLTSTPPPTYLLATSEPPEMLSSSVMASSAPLPALSSSLSTSSLLSSSYSLPSLLPLFSSPSSISQSDDSGRISTPVATTAVRRVPSTAAVAGSSPRETSKHSGTRQPPNTTTFTSTTSPPLPTTPMELLGGRIASTPVPTVVTENTSPRAATSQGGTAGKAPPLLTTASEAPQAVLTDAPLGTSPSATSHGVIVPAVALTTVKPIALTTPASHRPTLTDASTAKTHRAQTTAATKHVYTPGERTEAMDLTTAVPSKVTKENIPATSPPEAPPTIKTTVSVRTTLAATKRTTIPPPSSTAGVRTSPATDVDRCLSNPCPALATCNNTHGSYVCQCPLGYELEKGKCNLVRIFIGQVPLKPNVTNGKYADLKQVEGEILAMLDASLSGLPGYHHSTVKATREANFVHVSVQSTFSLASNVTFYDIVGSVQSYIRACKSSSDPCQFISSLKPLHRVGSLCKQKDPECDKETSECTDFDGVALCQCKSGYFKYNKMDHSCRACEDGYKLENETCVSCPFGLGGFNCGNPYQLITVVIAAAGGGLLLIMGIALIVTCCRKNKNDISKLIFKSGDFQMSPYAEYPKNPRAQEWGRETIEMQENGSTKNLLQMTDVYYSPTGLRNPELERNGLYPPYTGLPGSRHSCIYPGQYNPSFISDETRRRDYF
ncbi:protein HEG homolog 1 isoform X3 [Oxyura jamaicensis]|uniref:protein HEG homolog 1 isoform X3 n=1 Tax=Oxyura jamaicensis TaxID=8884 RepID=UPI0015A72050|nr:protein HEG homolog 1 isoform X3 [Oxyura jamaicensis]